MTKDPLSDIITLSGARCTVTRVMQSDGDWHFRFDAPGTIKFVAITCGRCWLTPANAEPLELREGDVFMLLGDRPFAMASDLSAPVDDATGRFTATAPVGGEEWAGFQAICGHVALHPDRGRLLADAMPPVILVLGTAPEAAAMRWLLDQLVIEINGERHGAALAATELAQLLFVHMIRACISSGEPLPIGWIGALADDRIARALRLLHTCPAEPWRVESLAARVGMSRTSFAVRFSALVGTPPLSYLSAWRLRIAEEALRTSNEPITQIASAAGFAAASGFSSAFRRVFGASPKQYRRSAPSTAISKSFSLQGGVTDSLTLAAPQVPVADPHRRRSPIR